MLCVPGANVVAADCSLGKTRKSDKIVIVDKLKSFAAIVLSVPNVSVVDCEGASL